MDSFETDWSVVRAARAGGSAQAQAALETLCRTYWHPVYAFVRRRGFNVEDAQDLTQAFFVQLLERDFLRNVAQERGRFRAFLLVSLRNFLAQQWKRDNAAKRGGGLAFVSWEALQAEARQVGEIPFHCSAEDVYDQHWAQAVMDEALARLRAELHSEGKGKLFDGLRPVLMAAGSKHDYARIGPELDLTADAVAVTVHRLRRRFGQLVREVVADTVSDPADIEPEMQALASYFCAGMLEVADRPSDPPAA